MKRTFQITDEMVRSFAEVTGDKNPLHLDDEFAKGTRFGQRIVHGALLVGLVSNVLANDFPGPGTIIRNLSIDFLKPVPVGAEVSIIVAETDSIYGFYISGEELYAKGKMDAIPPKKKGG